MKKFITYTVFLLLCLSCITAQTRGFVLEQTEDTSTVTQQQTKTSDSRKMSAPELVVNDWHNGSPNYAAFGHDGSYFLSSGTDEVKIWDSKTGNLLRTIYCESAEDVRLSPKEDVFVGRTEDGFGLYSVATGQLLRESDNWAYNFSFSSDGKLIAASASQSLTLYDAKTLEPVMDFEALADNFSYDEIEITKTGNYLIVVTSNDSDADILSNYSVWNCKTGKLIKMAKVGRRITAFAVSPNEKYIALGFYDEVSEGAIELHDLKTATLVKKFYTGEGAPYIDDLEFSASSTSLYSADSSYLKGWGIPNAQELSSIDESSYSISLSPDGKQFVVAHYDNLTVYQASDGKVIKKIQKASGADCVSYNPKSSQLYIYDYLEKAFLFDQNFSRSEIPPELISVEGIKAIVPFDTGTYFMDTDYTKSGRLYCWDRQKNSVSTVCTLEKYYGKLSSSNDGKIVAYTRDNNTAQIVELPKNRNIGNVQYEDFIDELEVSPSGKFIKIVTSESLDYTTDIINIATNQGVSIKLFSSVYTGSFTADDKYFITTLKDENEKPTVTIFDTSTWKVVKEFSGKNSYKVGDYISPDGKYTAIINLLDNVIEITELATERTIQKIPIDGGSPSSLFFTQDNSKILTSSFGGTFKIFSVKTGELLATIICSKDGTWITYTPEGYFMGSKDTSSLIHIVDGMEVYDLGQAYDTLYRPDLVVAKLEGKKIPQQALQDAFSSGDAPSVSFNSVPVYSPTREIEIQFTVQDTGGGIGAVYLVQNGERKLLQEKGEIKSSVGDKFTYTCTVILASGENTFEAFATNAGGKIESRHATAKISWTGKTEKPNLYVLALGVNKYQSSSNRLNYAVPDAESIAEAFKTAPGGLYDTVNIITLLDEKVTKQGISAAFASLALQVKPDDVFILYIAGHGVTVDGDYYFIPVDCIPKKESDIPRLAVSKTFITESFSDIAAQKKLILLDTCHSGAFVSESTSIEQKTAIERLAHDSGQAIIAASSSAQLANEGYNGHGVFTYALLEALSGKANATYGNTQTISATELITYVNAVVPQMSLAKFHEQQTPWNFFQAADFDIVATGNAPSSRLGSITNSSADRNSSWFYVTDEPASGKAVASTTTTATKNAQTTKSTSSTDKQGRHGIYLGGGEFFSLSEGKLFMEGPGVMLSMLFPVGPKFAFAGAEVKFSGQGLRHENLGLVAFPSEDNRNFHFATPDGPVMTLTFNAVMGISTQIGKFLPYLYAGGGGYVILLTNVKNVQLETETLFGIMAEAAIGFDIKFNKFAIGLAGEIQYIASVFTLSANLNLGWSW